MNFSADTDRLLTVFAAEARSRRRRMRDRRLVRAAPVPPRRP